MSSQRKFLPISATAHPNPGSSRHLKRPDGAEQQSPRRYWQSVPIQVECRNKEQSVPCSATVSNPVVLEQYIKPEGQTVVSRGRSTSSSFLRELYQCLSVVQGDNSTWAIF